MGGSGWTRRRRGCGPRPARSGREDRPDASFAAVYEDGLGDLPRANGGRIDFQNLKIFLDLEFEPVDPDHRFDPAVDARLGLCGRFLDAEFRDARFDGLRHAAQCLRP